jgi:hypothetical protein
MEYIWNFPKSMVDGEIEWRQLKSNTSYQSIFEPYALKQYIICASKSYQQQNGLPWASIS